MAEESVDTFYDYWNDLLDGKKPPFYDGKPRGGTYWMKGRAGAKVPVRIDYLDKEMPELGIGVWVENVLQQPQAANQTWLNCGRNAVDGDAYAKRMETGRWADEAGAVELGGNNPPPDEVHELLPWTIDQVGAWFVKMGSKFTTAEDLQAAADHANNLRTLKGKATKLHKTEKAPHLEAGRVVDTKYNPSIAAAELLVGRLEKAAAVFEQAARDAREAEDTKLRAEQEATLRAAIAGATAAPPERRAEAVQAAIAAGALPSTPPPAPVTTKIKSSTGKAGFTIKPKATAEITNRLTLFQAVCDRPEVIGLLQKIAQQELDSGNLLPGVKSVEGLEATR